MPTLDELREEIRQAFPPAPFYGVVTRCDCEECSDLRNALAHKRWDEVPVSFIDFTCSPTLLTPEAFAAFLPAYLLRALDGLTGETVVLEFTIYDLSPYENREDVVRRFRERRLSAGIQLMTREQVRAVSHFLEFVSTNAKDATWCQPFIQAALVVWSPREGKPGDETV